ncbi:MAG: MBL fold metallo-hydrolase, partial [Acidimicrobiia bacterium]
MAPAARLVGNSLTIGWLTEMFDLPYACVRAVNPGEMLPLVDRVVRVVRSSIFDSPGTTGFLD